MGTVDFWVKGGGRHEFSCGRLERMLRGACRSFNLGLEPWDITVKSDGPICTNGANGPLQLTVELSGDLLEQLAPPLDPKAKTVSDPRGAWPSKEERKRASYSFGPAPSIRPTHRRPQRDLNPCSRLERPAS